MNAWKLLLPGMLCLTLTACRTDPNRALLERELRLQEDEIYRLQDCIEEGEATLASCRRENDALRRRLVETPLRALDYPTPSPPSAAPRSPAPAAPMRIVPEAVPMPSVEIPSAEVVPKPPATSDGPSLGGALGLGGPKAEIISGDSRQVSRVALNTKLTGGYRKTRGGGHEGVLVVIEPRDQQGRIIAAPGELNIVVVDPKLPDEFGRIARWDFAAEETMPLFQQKGLGPGFQIELPWPGDPPQHADLHLFVRYGTSDGRKLQADKPIKVELAGEPRGPRPDGPMLSDRDVTGEPPRLLEAQPAPHIADNAAAADKPAAPEPAGPKRPVWSPERK